VGGGAAGEVAQALHRAIVRDFRKNKAELTPVPY
jgi:hypothetical protein